MTTTICGEMKEYVPTTKKRSREESGDASHEKRKKFKKRTRQQIIDAFEAGESNVSKCPVCSTVYTVRKHKCKQVNISSDISVVSCDELLRNSATNGETVAANSQGIPSTHVNSEEIRQKDVPERTGRKQQKSLKNSVEIAVNEEIIQAIKTKPVQWKKYTIEDAHKLAEAYGGTCLSEVFSTCKGRYVFKCRVPAHAPFTSIFANVLHNQTWCKQCRGFTTWNIYKVRCRV